MMELHVYDVKSLKKLDSLIQPAFIPRKDEKIEINGIVYCVEDVVYNSKNSIIQSVDLIVHKA